MLGGVLGLVAGFLGMRALLAVNTAGLPRLGEAGSLLGMDWRVVTFTLALSLATGTLFGLVPALAGSRTDLNAVIKDSSSRSGSGFRQNKTRSVLVTLEVGLAVVLLIGAALLIRTSLALGQVDPGFNATNVLTLRTSLSGPRFLTTDTVAQTAQIALERIRSIAGVTAATATCCVPLQDDPNLPFNIVGRVNDQGPFTGGAGFVIGTSGYFETLQIPVLRGRAFNDRDTAAAPPVAIINQAFAKEFWAEGADPLSDRILIGGAIMRELAEEPARQIIGIVGDVRANSLGSDPGPAMYVPQPQIPDAFNAFVVASVPMTWVVRTRGESAAVSAAVQEELRLTTGVPVTDVQSMEKIVSISTSRQRLNMLLMSVFGGAALLLAAIGIYGLMAYSVEQRTQEIGVRMALGAQPSQVKNMVVRQSVVLVAIGVAVGLVAAFYLANLLAAILFGVEPRDAAVFVTVPIVLTLVALAAASIAARRASRVDPLEALHYE
jgi:predicted permease